MLSKQHLIRNPEERFMGTGRNSAAVTAQFNRADMLLQSVAADIVNGLTRNDIIMKFHHKQYEYQRKKISENQAIEYINMAYKILAEDRVKEQDKLRDQLYNQYLALYNECVVNNNQMTAKQILDSIGKIFLNEERKVDVSVNGNNVKISFGFDDKEE